MSLQLATDVRNGTLDAIETVIGTSPILRLYSGSLPADCAASEAGTLLAEGTLPSDWLNAASSGSKTRNGTYTLTGQSGAGSGTNVTHFRLFESTGTTCKAQGTVTGAGDGGDIEMDNINVASGQSINVATFTFNAGGA